MAVAWTEDQQKILNHRYGNLLVSAAAGSGKTAVLIERLVQILTDPQDPVFVDELLIVTFTAQAAAQMRDKLYQRLSRILEETGDFRVQRQLQMLPTASIMTIHAFCLQCIRDYITRIEGLDPGFRIADATEAALLQADVLEEVLEESYGWAAENPETEEAQYYSALVNAYSGSRQDQRLEELIEKTETFLSGVIDVESWLTHAVEAYNAADEEALKETLWYPMMRQVMQQQMDKALGIYQQLIAAYIGAGAAPANKTVAAMQEIVLKIRSWTTSDIPVSEFTVSRMDYSLWKEDPAGKKRIQGLAADVKEAIKEAAAIPSRWVAEGSAEKMRKHAYPALKGLEWLYHRYRKKYQLAKQDKNIVDFEDLERYALAILRDEAWKPTREAMELQEQFRYICIDEYQDSNDVQEAVLTSIARVDEEGNPVNIFMVGDVKQSIYKFRQARPELFLEKQERYKNQKGASRIFLHQNFRSRASILEAVNDVFRALMYKPGGEIDYTEEEALVAGRKYPESELPLVSSMPVLTVLTSESPMSSREAMEAEADYTARRIQTLVMEGHQIWDDESKSYRPVRFQDVVILLRSMQAAAPVYQEALRKYRVPSYSEITSGFYQTKEIQCVVNMLRIIDNPLQDIPLMGVLYSPVFGYTGHEAAQLRLTGGRNQNLYNSLVEYAEVGNDVQLKTKVEAFLETLQQWREWASYYSIHDLLWKLYQETGYYRYIAAAQDGEFRKANLDLLLLRAQQYEKGSYSGLFHFLRYIEKMEKQSRDDVEAKILGEEDNVVRVMSIHKSKGLEFPVVFLGGCGHGFNMMDLREPVLFHTELGIGTEAIDAEEGFRYETLPHLALREKKRKEAYAEEMRVLYVAMTRASEYLEVIGYRKNDAAETELVDGYLPFYAVQEAAGYLEWLEPIATASSMWRTRRSVLERPQEAEEETVPAEKTETVDAKLYNRLDQYMQWKYPYDWKRRLPVRLSVSRIKETAEEAETYIRFIIPDEKEEPSGAQVGTALHTVLSQLDLQSMDSKEQIQQQLEAMVQQGFLSAEEKEQVSMEQLEIYAHSALVKRMRESHSMLREQPFIVQFTIGELRKIVSGWMQELEEADEKERIMVQGMIDCCFIENGKWILVDYKSDRYIDDERMQEYQRQLQLYRKALENITGIEVVETILYQTRRGQCIYV